MRQLTGLDAQFLAMETPRQSGHVSMMMVLDPSTRPGGSIELEDIHALVAERLPLLPPFRWRLREVPFALDYPYWIDDPDFDLDYHVRELALAPPPTDEKLATQVARIAARPLDRARPLWELYLIHGLEHGHVALLTKIHHAAVDGMSGAEILGALLDTSPEGRDVPAAGDRGADGARRARDVRPRPRRCAAVLVPGGAGAAVGVSSLEDNPLLSELPGAKTLGRTARFVRAWPRRDSTELERSTFKPPRTSFNGRVSPHRKFAFGRLSLEQAKAVKNRHACTLNDVVMAVCAGAVRRWLIEHGELPDGPLVAQVPISVRTEAQRGTFGNRIGVLSTPLYTDEPDPVQRLSLTREALRVAKERHKAVPARMLQHDDGVHPARGVRPGDTRDAGAGRGAARPSGTSSSPTCPGRRSRSIARGRRCAPVPDLGRLRRARPEHHRVQLLRAHRRRDRGRPRADAGPLEADRMARRVACRARGQRPRLIRSAWSIGGIVGATTSSVQVCPPLARASSQR